MNTKTAGKKSEAMEHLEKHTGGPLTFPKLIESIRLGEGMSQTDFANELGISKSHLCDIEKGRKTVSPDRAARFAKKLGYSQNTFVELALQQMVSKANLKFKVKVEAA